MLRQCFDRCRSALSRQWAPVSYECCGDGVDTGYLTTVHDADSWTSHPAGQTYMNPGSTNQVYPELPAPPLPQPADVIDVVPQPQLQPALPQGEIPPPASSDRSTRRWFFDATETNSKNS